jgi:SAM-dependent methyltransferase
MPGSIAEIGVFKGGSLFTWHHLLETFLPGERMRKIYAFDHFKGYDLFGKEDADSNWVKEKHGGNLLDDANSNLIFELVEMHNKDSYLPGVERIVLIEGDILKTIPQFKKENMGTRFSLINLDVNLYKPTKCALENLYDLLLPGGIIMFSGYTAPPWEGESKAIEEFFKDKKVKIQKLDFSPYPRAFIIKEQEVQK